MENIMLTANILWRNGSSGVFFLKCPEILGQFQLLGYGKVNLSVCCCFGARPLKFGIEMLDLVGSNQLNIDSIDMLISDLTRGQ